MKRWSKQQRKIIEDKKIDSFIEDIEKVCKKHNMSISHEDHHGAFEIEKYEEYNIGWLKNAHKSF